jgi:hypothetical protein
MDGAHLLRVAINQQGEKARLILPGQHKALQKYMNPLRRFWMPPSCTVARNAAGTERASISAQVRLLRDSWKTGPGNRGLG